MEDNTLTNLANSNIYRLCDFNSEARPPQSISFYEMGADGSIQGGTTVEEPLRVSIARIKDLNSRFPCRENSIAITKMEEGLLWLNERTRERKSRGVEGKHIL